MSYTSGTSCVIYSGSPAGSEFMTLQGCIRYCSVDMSACFCTGHVKSFALIQWLGDVAPVATVHNPTRRNASCAARWWFQATNRMRHIREVCESKTDLTFSAVVCCCTAGRSTRHAVAPETRGVARMLPYF